MTPHCEEARHSRRQLATEGQIQRQMLERILAGRLWPPPCARRMEMLDRFALHEDRIGPFGENGLHRQLVPHAHVADRAAERGLVCQRLVPESPQRGKAGADEDLVDRRVVADPRIAPRKGARVAGEEHRKRRILKTAEPVWNTEMTEVRDQLDPLIAQRMNRLVGTAPVEPSGATWVL